MIGSLLVACVCYRVWNADLGIPFAYSGDGLTNSMAFKAVIENGTIWSNPYLAAPFTQHYQDWPLTDLLPLYVAKVFSLFTDNWAALQNIIYLIEFPAIGLAAWWAMRKLGVSPWVATALSILYAIAPYHFGRGPSHYFLSGYFAVPLGVWMAMTVLAGGTLFVARESVTNPKRFANWHNLRTVLFAVVLVSSSIYYAAFTAILLITAAVVMLFKRRWSHVVQVGVVFVVMALTFVMLAAPTFAYRDDYGANVLGAKRLESDTETYGLKLAQMLLPNNGYRIQALAQLRGEYVSKFPVPGEYISTALGLVASIGLLYLLFVIARRLVGRSSADETESHLALLTLVALISATVGGFATLVSLLITSQIRGWNRMSIVIAFMSLVAVGLLIDKAARKFVTLRKPVVAAALLAILLAFGAFDQFGMTQGIAYAQNRQVFQDDADFFAKVEATMPANSRVFQLPRTQFPEPMKLQYNQMDAYDPLRPYLHTKNLRWSYGGIEGRVEADWQSRLDFFDVPTLLDQIVAAEFTGLYIDRYAYQDRAVDIETQVSSITGAKPLVSRNGRMSFFDLRDFSEKRHSQDSNYMQLMRESLFFPVTVQVSAPAYRPQCQEASCFVWAPKDVTLPLNNVSRSAQATRITFQVVQGFGLPTNFVVHWPDGKQQEVTAADEPIEVAHEMTLEPGFSQIEIDSNAASVKSPTDTQEMNFRIIDMTVAPSR